MRTLQRYGNRRAAAAAAAAAVAAFMVPEGHIRRLGSPASALGICGARRVVMAFIRKSVAQGSGF